MAETKENGMRDFEGKTVFISGARRGIGRAMVTAFAERGADIIAHARRQDNAFEDDMREEADKRRVAIRPIYFDLADADTMKREVKALLKDMTPDVLVNNAAVQHGAYFLMTPIKAARDVFEINLFAQMRLTQLLLKPMLAHKSGAVINMASISGMDMKPGMSAYGASKAAIIAWTRVLAAEAGNLGVRVNAIAPGLSDTEGGALMEAKAKAAMLAASAMHRMGKPEEIARTACFLASDAASFINGAVIRVDGGIA